MRSRKGYGEAGDGVGAYQSPQQQIAAMNRLARLIPQIVAS
jgi:hypothetical protein